MQLVKSETRLLRELAGEVQDEYYNGDVSCTPDVLPRTRGRTDRAKPLRLSCVGKAAALVRPSRPEGA